VLLSGPAYLRASGLTFQVVIVFDQMRPASFALRGFEAPLDQFADITLVLENVEDFWWLGRWLVWIERFVQLVLRTNGRHRLPGRQLPEILFMSGQRFGETGSFDACESFFFPRSDTQVRMHSAPVFVFVNVLRFR
jgi:hypothetical protein